MQGIYTHTRIPEANHAPKQYNVTAILSLLFMVQISPLAYPGGLFGGFKPPTHKIIPNFDQAEPNYQLRGQYILRT
jgi:hypothetical protein